MIEFPIVLLSFLIIIGGSIAVKKIVAYHYEADISTKFWEFYQGYAKIQQTLSVKFSLSWSYYVVLLTISSEDERLVELILPKDANIHASAYQLYLPDKETLKKATHEKSSEVQDKGGNHE